MRLHLRVLLDLQSSPTVLSISLLIAQSKPGRPHQKLSAALESTVTLSSWHFLTVLQNKSSSVLLQCSYSKSFWWRRRESNPRLEHLSFYFIQQFCYFLSPNNCNRLRNIFIKSRYNVSAPRISLVS